jgi:hypothetical protein
MLVGSSIRDLLELSVPDRNTTMMLGVASMALLVLLPSSRI